MHTYSCIIYKKYLHYAATVVIDTRSRWRFSDIVLARPPHVLTVYALDWVSAVWSRDLLVWVNKMLIHTRASGWVSMVSHRSRTPSELPYIWLVRVSVFFDTFNTKRLYSTVLCCNSKPPRFPGARLRSIWAAVADADAGGIIT